MLGHPIRLPLRAMLTHILCRSCRRKTPFGLCLSLSRGPRLEGCYAGYIALPCARCSQAMERHLRPGKLCRPAGFRFADFSAPDLYLHALPRPLPRPSSFGLLRRLHRASLHSMFARLALRVHLRWLQLDLPKVSFLGRGSGFFSRFYSPLRICLGCSKL
jgi:hypothetical protein